MSIIIGLPSGNRAIVQADSILIGRDEACQICLSQESKLQPQHAKIRRIANRWLIETLGDWDLRVGSAVPSRKGWLQPGDVIHLAEGGPSVVFQPLVTADQVQVSPSTKPVPTLSPSPRGADVVAPVPRPRSAVSNGPESTTSKSTAPHRPPLTPIRPPEDIDVPPLVPHAPQATFPPPAETTSGSSYGLLARQPGSLSHSPPTPDSPHRMSDDGEMPQPLPGGPQIRFPHATPKPVAARGQILEDAPHSPTPTASSAWPTNRKKPQPKRIILLIAAGLLLLGSLFPWWSLKDQSYKTLMNVDVNAPMSVKEEAARKHDQAQDVLEKSKAWCQDHATSADWADGIGSVTVCGFSTWTGKFGLLGAVVVAVLVFGPIPIPERKRYLLVGGIGAFLTCLLVMFWLFSPGKNVGEFLQQGTEIFFFVPLAGAIALAVVGIQIGRAIETGEGTEARKIHGLFPTTPVASLPGLTPPTATTVPASEEDAPDSPAPSTASPRPHETEEPQPNPTPPPTLLPWMADDAEMPPLPGSWQIPFPESTVQLSASERSKRGSVRSSLVRRTKAAARIVGKQAERTKLVTVNLPGAYQSLGRQVHADGRFRNELSDCYQAIDKVTEEIKAVQSRSAGQPKAEGLAAKTKAAAKATAHVAQVKTLQIRLQHALADLGKSAFERYGEKCGPADLAQPIVDVRSKIAVLDAQIRELSAAAPSQILTPKRIAVCAVSMVLFLVAFLGYRLIAPSTPARAPVSSNDPGASSSSSKPQQAADGSSIANKMTCDSFARLYAKWCGNRSVSVSTQVQIPGFDRWYMIGGKSNLPIPAGEVRKGIGKPDSVEVIERNMSGTEQYWIFHCKDGDACLRVIAHPSGYIFGSYGVHVRYR